MTVKRYRVMFETFKNGKELFNTLTVDNGL